MVHEAVARRSSSPLEVCVGRQRWVVPPGESITIGRDVADGVQIADEQVTRRHAVVEPTAAGWLLTDHSCSGLFLDGRRMQQVLVTGPTAVCLGDPEGVLVAMAPVRFSGPASASAAPAPTHARMSGVHELPAVRTTIGRLTGNDVVVDDLLVSRRHAVLHRGAAGWRIRDLGSANGTYLGGRAVTDAAVVDGDLIGVGHALFQLTGDRLVEYVDSGEVDIVARDLVVTRGGRRLLDAVGFHLPGGRLLAVLGPSGSGKSTLLGALSGTRPADSGEVRYGGRDLCADYDELRQRIGLVPQDDILHPQLKVRRALSHAARLRFPPDVPAADRERRIGEVLAEIGLTEQAHQRIDSLSGGQRKRTSVALELLTQPSLLFLDEPTSGLDPGLDKQVMQNLRALADDGRTVVVVTHSIANLDVCHRLLVLASGGRVAYDGPPDGAPGYFQVTDLADVFLLFDREKSVDWTARFQNSEHHRRDRRRAPQRPARARPAQFPPRTGSAPTQYRVLCRRTLDVMVADRAYLVFLALLPVLLSGLARAVPSPNGLSVQTGSPRPGQLLLVLVVGGALMGTASSIRELVKERAIYQRERAIGLSSIAYLASKLTVLGLVTAVQAMVFAALAMLGRPGPDDPVLLASGKLEVAAAVIAVTIASMVLGLVISAAISNADRGMPLLVLVVMLQLVVSGGLFPLEGRAGLEQLAWAVPARWAYGMGTVTIDQVRVPTSDTDPLLRHEPVTLVADALVLGGLTLLLVVLVGLLLRRFDPPRRRPAR
ncbi:ATP-binding cassette domain-containing protein [Pseudonocardia sp. H11422]|uniref:ATP-binding cassette domain-containing protein n=1 Tax=Pseudonocardia sp. H11422 TaxID=2835866 RepID=UPI0020295BCA